MTLRKMTTKRSFFDRTWILIAAVPAGILVGVAYYFISRLLPFILVDTFLAALLGLLIFGFLDKKAAVASSRVAVLYALLFTLFSYGAYRLFDYLVFRNGAIRYLQSQGYASTLAAAEFETRLLHLAGAGGFWGYLVALAETGVGISPLIGYQGIVAPVGGDLRLSGVIMWLFWFLEFLLIGGLMTWIGVRAARTPFAGTGVGRLGTQAGNVSIDRAEEFARLLEAEAFEEAWRLVTIGDEAPHPTVEVYIHMNEGKDAGNSVVLAAVTDLDQKGRVHRKELFWTEVPNDRLPEPPAGLALT
jgi:hypothetical protein